MCGFLTQKWRKYFDFICLIFSHNQPFRLGRGGCTWPGGGDARRGGGMHVHPVHPPTPLASDIAKPYKFNVTQRSCADVNSPCKRKCWTNSVGPLYQSLLWIHNTAEYGKVRYFSVLTQRRQDRWIRIRQNETWARKTHHGCIWWTSPCVGMAWEAVPASWTRSCYPQQSSTENSDFIVWWFTLTNITLIWVLNLYKRRKKSEYLKAKTAETNKI